MQYTIIHTVISLSLAFTALACRPRPTSVESEVKVSGNQVGSLKGVKLISEILASRMMEEGFDLIDSISRNMTLKEVSTLLGSHEGVGIKNRYGNGTPNSVNMFLWSTVLANFTTEVAEKVCGNKNNPFSSFTLNPSAASLFKSCSDEETSLKLGADPREIWDLLLQMDAPESEFQAWEAWIKSADFEKSYKSSPERLVAAMTAALMNPYFLLER